MRKVILSLALAGVIAFVAIFAFLTDTSVLSFNSGFKIPHGCEGLEEKWEAFKSDNPTGVSLEEIEQNEETYFQTFCENIKDADRAQARSNKVSQPNVEPAQFGYNSLTLIPKKEFKKTHQNLIIPESYKKLKLSSSQSTKLGGATTVDWTSKVTNVKDQGGCGSCWSFAAVGALEALYRIENEDVPYVDFSEQQLLDCDRQSFGCKGGFFASAMQIVVSTGLAHESDYPYQTRQGYCSRAGTWKIAGVKNIRPGDVVGLENAVGDRPVAVAIDSSTWQGYKGGVLSNCGTRLDHAVVLVGYTGSYWLIKNSWGRRWGEKGYIKLAKGDTCGITRAAAQPIGTGVKDANKRNTPKPHEDEVGPNPDESGCADLSSACPYWANHGDCTDAGKRAEMIRQCKKSCNECDNDNNNNNDNNDNNNNNNQNTDANCRYWATIGECRRNPNYMKHYCAKHCNDLQRNCWDQRNDCYSLAVGGYCTNQNYWVFQGCPKSCGVC